MNLSNKGLLLAIAAGYCIHGTSATLEQLQLMHFGGRWWKEGKTMTHSWGVGSFLVKFRSSSQLKVQLQSGWSAGLYYTCKINDGASFELYHENSNDLSVAANLDSADEYVVWCGRNNEASYGATILSGVVLDTGGELLPVIQMPGTQCYVSRLSEIQSRRDSKLLQHRRLSPAPPTTKMYSRHIRSSLQMLGR